MKRLQGRCSHTEVLRLPPAIADLQQTPTLCLGPQSYAGLQTRRDHVEERRRYDHDEWRDPCVFGSFWRERCEWLAVGEQQHVVCGLERVHHDISGAATSDKRGYVALSVGNGNSGSGGDVLLTARGSSSSGGKVSLTSGAGSAANSGDVTVSTGAAGTTGVSGTVSVKRGSVGAGVTRSVLLSTGACTGGNNGPIGLSVGSGSNGVGGSVNVRSGDSTGSGTTTGPITLTR
ncbi:hypothetical protein ATCC90586_012185 [Pythium insidiosum]|nr:hypothetical protein ATCC90586_012185 [Pythium insidiosum]